MSTWTEFFPPSPQSLNAEASPSFSRSPANYRNAIFIAFILSVCFTVVSLIVPPAINSDPGTGLLEWRTLQQGGPANSITAPDPGDLAHDRTQFITWWSPGQYLVPGLLTELGLPLGIAITATAGASFLLSLWGWIRLYRHFGVPPNLATIGIVLLSLFPHSTLSFRMYSGGETLLEGVTPWIYMAALSLEGQNVVNGALLTAAIVLLGFFAKLSGMLVAIAAIVAAVGIAFMHGRRPAKAVAGIAIGSAIAFLLIYVFWLAHGQTPGNGAGWSLPIRKMIFVAAAPWGAGVSWLDVWQSLLHRSLWQALPIQLGPILFFAAIIFYGWTRQRANAAVQLGDLIQFTAIFYIVYTIAMEIMFMHNAPISVEERHFSPPGTLIFACAIAVVSSMRAATAVRAGILAVCGFVSAYGLYLFVARTASVDASEIDGYSRTRQLEVDPKALDYTRAAFLTEGRAALFLLPNPDAANGFPLGARLLVANLLAEPASFIANRKYSGAVPGHVYVLIPAEIARSTKASLVLRQFRDYSLNGWRPRRVGRTTIFVHDPMPRD